MSSHRAGRLSCACAARYPFVYFFRREIHYNHIMAKIKIRCDSDSPPDKLDILQIFNAAEVKCSKLIWISDEQLFLAYCADDNNADQIFSSSCLTALSALSCSPVLPAYLKAKRTVIVKRLNNHIYNNDVSSIMEEINSCNDFMSVIDVFKFPNAKWIKVTCASQVMAAAAIKNGLRMFNLYVPCLLYTSDAADE